MLLSQPKQKKFSQYRPYFFEFLGSERYSRPYRRGVGKKIEQCLPKQGFFIEVGANDGFSESNTYYLERFRNWQGILVEAIPHLASECKQERPHSTVFNCALVASDYPHSTVEMVYGHLMSVVKGAFQDQKKEEEHAAKAGRALGFTPYTLSVPARTLTSILDEMNVSEIDFFSLDVEGFELNVLKGLNLDKYRPKYILTECLTPEFLLEITSYLAPYYEKPQQISPVDYWFKKL